MLALSTMGATAQAIFYIVGLVLFVAGGIGIKVAGEKVSLISLGLAAVTFVTAWNALAAT